MTDTLGRDQWVRAGLQMLAEHGADAVRVERLASLLGVTKGSFYWHFASRRALLDAMVEAWKARATSAIIARVETAGGSPGDRLRALMEIVFSADGKFERQIRAWAANDDSVRAAQEGIDRERVGYLERLFAEMGFGPAEAHMRAELIYCALMGRFAMGGSGVGLPAFDVAGVYGLLTRR